MLDTIITALCIPDDLLKILRRCKDPQAEVSPLLSSPAMSSRTACAKRSSGIKLSTCSRLCPLKAVSTAGCTAGIAGILPMGGLGMTLTMAILVALMVLLGGSLAYGGDWLGRRLGKQRLSLLGLRPRYTATLITTLTGALTVALTILVMTLANEAFRVWITRGDQILIELKRNEQMLRQRASELKSLQTDLRQKVEELDKLRPQYEQFRTQVVQLEQRLRQGQQQLALMEERLNKEKQQVQQLSNERTRLNQQVQELDSQRTKLEKEIAHLEQMQGILRRQNDDFAKENTRLASENAQLEKQNQQLQEQNAQLSEQSRQLREQNEQLESQNRWLLDRAAELRRRVDDLESQLGDLLRLVNIRVAPIALHAGEELTRVSFRAGLSEVRVRQLLKEMMEQAAQQAQARGAAAGADGRIVFIPEKVVRLASGEEIKVDETASLETILQNIRAASDSVVALVVAVTNTARGEPVPVEVRLFRNSVVFRPGQEIARTVLDCRPGQDPFRQIVAFLQGSVREAAIEAGLIPRTELYGASPTVGELDAALLLTLAEKARRCPGDRALLIARARQEIRAGDTLQLEFEVQPLVKTGQGT